MPVTALKTVVLPAPFGPMTEKICPGSTVRSTAFTAVIPPNRIVNFSILSRDIGSPGVLRFASRLRLRPTNFGSRRGLAGRFVRLGVQLPLVPGLGDQPLRAEPHHQDEDHAEDEQLPPADPQ